MPDVELLVTDCPYCGGVGATAGCCGALSCEECDGSGARYRATWTTDDSLTCSMTGRGRIGPDANDRALMELVARSAMGRESSAA